MWSVWSDTADIYLGQSLSMIKPRGKQVAVLQHPATLPLEQVLSRLSKLAARDVRKGSRLNVSLSGTLCPAIGFAVPKGLRGWKELHETARANAAILLESEPAAIACELDATRSGVTAAMSHAMSDTVHSWAKEQGWRVASLQPLWARSTWIKAVKNVGVLAIVLQEPDATTLIVDGAQGTLDAVTFTGLPESPDLQSVARRWLASHGLTDEKVFRIGFAATPRTVISGAPEIWSAHWSKL